jgi:hypothetical protein
MSDSLAQTVPWNPPSEQKTAASETTPGGIEPTPWVVVAANLNPVAALVIKARLESEGLAAIVRQEALGVVLGLTVGPLGSAQVLTPQSQAEQALAILAETFEVNEDEGEA